MSLELVKVFLREGARPSIKVAKDFMAGKEPVGHHFVTHLLFEKRVAGQPPLGPKTTLGAEVTPEQLAKISRAINKADVHAEIKVNPHATKAVIVFYGPSPEPLRKAWYWKKALEK